MKKKVWLETGLNFWLKMTWYFDWKFVETSNQTDSNPWLEPLPPDVNDNWDSPASGKGGGCVDDHYAREASHNNDGAEGREKCDKAAKIQERKEG